MVKVFRAPRSSGTVARNNESNRMISEGKACRALCNSANPVITLISTLESGFAFGIRLRISSNLFSASDFRLIPAS
jgi:hypothetical protein